MGEQTSLLQSWTQQNVHIVLSGPSIPSLRMLSALDPADLKRQFEVLAGSALLANQPPSELRLLGPQSLLGSESWGVAISLFLELFI